MERFPKNLELRFRRFLISFLSRLVHSRRPFPKHVDFNKCTFLFVRQDRIGDVLVSTPLFKALKDKYRGAVIDVLLSSNNHFVLANDPLIRKRWVYRKTLFSGLQILRDIRRERYDFVIDLMDNPSATSTVICLLAGARWSVGLQKDNAYAYDVVVPLLSRKESHIIERIAQLLTPFGIDPAREDLRIRFTIPRGADEFATRAFSALGIKGRRTIGINISAGDAVRFWGRDNFCSLITLIQQHDRNVTVIVMSTPSQRVDAEDIARGFTKVFVPPPTHSFDEFAALIARCDMLITPDTSAVHLATAFGVPVLALYVQSNKNLRIWEPYKALSEVLVADVDDLRVISPLEVFKAFQRLQRAKLRKVPGKPLRTASPT